MPGKRRHRSKRKGDSATAPPWHGQTSGLELIGEGLSSMVFAIDDKRVFKLGVGTERRLQDVKTEQKAYDIIDREREAGRYSPFLLRRISSDPRGIVLERCQETLRDRLASSTNTNNRHLEWALQACDGLAFLHFCNIIQGDVGCHNMLVTIHDDIRVCDFAGSSVQGSKASVTYEPGSSMPNLVKPTIQSDIFALGSAMYEMSTGYLPYHEKTRLQIRGLYRDGIFPDTDNLDLGAVIEKCWRGEFHSVDDIIDYLDESLDSKLPKTQI